MFVNGAPRGEREETQWAIEEYGGRFLHRDQFGKTTDVNRHFLKFILERVALSPMQTIALSGSSLAFLKLKRDSKSIATAVCVTKMVLSRHSREVVMWVSLFVGHPDSKPQDSGLLVTRRSGPAPVCCPATRPMKPFVI